MNGRDKSDANISLPVRGFSLIYEKPLFISLNRVARMSVIFGKNEFFF